LAANLDGSLTGSRERRPDCGVERDVVIARTSESVPCVLTSAPIDERPCPAAEPRPFQAVDAAAVVENPSVVDADGLDARCAVRNRVCVER
jgi:hypothetical protein